MKTTYGIKTISTYFFECPKNRECLFMKFKKIISVVLTLLLLFSVAPTGVFTLGASAVQSDAYATVISASDF